MIHPTKAELGILRVLWERGPLSVRNVHSSLNAAKPTGHTTVLKLMQIMTEKGLLARDTSVRPQSYRARQNQTRMQKCLLLDFVDRVYGGSVTKLVAHALSIRSPLRRNLKQFNPRHR